MNHDEVTKIISNIINTKEDYETGDWIVTPWLYTMDCPVVFKTAQSARRMAFFWLNWIGYVYGDFKWPGGEAAFGSHEKNYYYGNSLVDMPGSPDFIPSWNGNKVTTLLQRYNLSAVKEVFNITGPDIGTLHLIAYCAGERRIYNHEEIPVSDITQGVNAVGGSSKYEADKKGDNRFFIVDVVNLCVEEAKK